MELQQLRASSRASSSPTGRPETFTYNASGALTAVTMPGGWTTTFTYNSSGELAAIAEPGGRT